MLKIVEVLGTSWSIGRLVYDYLTGALSWGWMIDAGFIAIGIVNGAIANVLKVAAKKGLARAIRGLARDAAIAL